MKVRLILKKFAVSCIAGAVVFTSAAFASSAAKSAQVLPKAGATLENVVSEGSLPSAGLSLDVNKYQAQPVQAKEAAATEAVETQAAVEETQQEAVEETQQEVVEEQQEAVEEQQEAVEEQTAESASSEKSEYDDIAIAQVDGYINVREDSNTDSEIVGKLYNNSAATVVDEDGEWLEISSGSVHGFIKKQFVVVGDATLAKTVGHRVAVVQAESLRVREKESVESDIIDLVPVQEVLEVVSEGEGWVQVAVGEGDGFVSNDYVTCETRYTVAESKEEEEARIAEEARVAEEAEQTEQTEQTEQQDTENGSETDSESSASDNTAEEGASISVDETNYDDSASVSVDEASSEDTTDAGSYDDSASISVDEAGSEGSDNASISADTGSTGGASVASFACQFVGNPYVWGGESLTNGADCSGFVMSVYANFGISLPHSSGAIAGCGTPVTDGNYQPGDVICFNGHVGIYIGNGQMVHASNPTNGIIISNYNYRSDIVSVRRFL